MRYRYLSLYVAIVTVVNLPTWCCVAHADEAINHLSLGVGSVTLVKDDPKAPAPCLLTAKYGFSGLNGLFPYLGTGLAYTLSPESKGGNNVKFSAGFAGQVGLRYLLGSNSSLNIDYNYLYLSPELNKGYCTPQSIGVGVKVEF